MTALPLWILTAAYALHIVEEYFFDFRGWARRVSGFEVEWAEFFVVNAAVIVLGFACSAVGYAYPYFSYLLPGLALVNALFAHIGSSVVKRVYSPGLVTSLALFIPLSLWAYWDAWSKGMIGVPHIAVSLVGGLALMACPLLLQIIKRNQRNHESG
jgi:hypothetical protein